MKFFKDVDKARRKLLWTQDEETMGGKCKVSCPVITSPLDSAGLGIPDLLMFMRVLRLRWLWLAWKHPDRPGVGLGTPCDGKDQALFSSATFVSIRTGKQVKFWHCH